MTTITMMMTMTTTMMTTMLTMTTSMTAVMMIKNNCPDCALPKSGRPCNLSRVQHTITYLPFYNQEPLLIRAGLDSTRVPIRPVWGSCTFPCCRKTRLASTNGIPGNNPERVGSIGRQGHESLRGVPRTLVVVVVPGLRLVGQVELHHVA